MAELEIQIQEKNSLVARLEEDLLATKPASKSEPLDDAPSAANATAESGDNSALPKMVRKLCLDTN